MSQIQIKDAAGAVQIAAKVDNTGQTTRANSLPVVFSTEDIAALVPGTVGGIVNTSNTTAVTGQFKTIQLLTDTIFQSLSETGGSGSIVGLSLPAGLVLNGTFTTYTLASGAVRAYP